MFVDIKINNKSQNTRITLVLVERLYEMGNKD